MMVVVVVVGGGGEVHVLPITLGIKNPGQVLHKNNDTKKGIRNRSGLLCFA